MLLEFEDFKRRYEVVSYKDYNQHLPHLVNFLRMTRLPVLRRNGAYILAIQLGMLRTLKKFTDAIQTGSQFLRTEKDPDKVEALKKGLVINKSCARIIRTIADGIAWRAFNFNRPLLLIMSNNQGGQMDPDYPGLERFKSSKGFFIVNDLTRYLRIADITRVFPDGKLILYELKDDGRTIKDMGTILERMDGRHVPTKQNLRHLIAQSAIINGQLEVPIFESGRLKGKKVIEILNLPNPISNHLKKVRRMLAKANRSGFAHELLEEGMYLEMHALDVIVRTKNPSGVFEKLKADSEEKEPSWVSDPKVDSHSLSNYDGFVEIGNEFPRNITPASVLPFKARDCVRIMSGHIYVTVSVNLEILKSKLESEGWKVADNRSGTEIRSKEDFLKFIAERRGEFENYDDDSAAAFILSREESGRVFRIVLPFELVLIMMSTYYSFDFITNVVREMWNNRQKDTSGMQMINYLQERTILC